MIELAYPWLLLLLPAPLIVARFVRPHGEQHQAIRVPWFHRLADLLGKEPAEAAVVAERSFLQGMVSYALWALILLALSRPQYLEPPITRVIPTRDLMLLVDLSGSMETEDFTNAAGQTVDRLTAVKEVLDEFLTRREGDRVGLIVFGNAAFVQVPFTQDLDACRLLLEETAVRMAGPRTSLGDAIGLGITLFQQSEVHHRVIIALTDGNDTGSKIPPVEAAKIARDNGITIHVVAVGDPVATGESKLDELALTSVASTTHGRYYHASDRRQLQSIYTELDTIDTRQVEAQTHRPRVELFHWPLGAFMLIGLACHAATLLIQGIKEPRAIHG